MEKLPLITGYKLECEPLNAIFALTILSGIIRINSGVVMMFGKSLNI